QRNPDSPAKPVPFVYTDVFLRQVELLSRRSRPGREVLGRPAADVLQRQVAQRIASRTGIDPTKLTVRDVLGFRARDLAELTGANAEDLAQARLRLLGVELRRSRKPSESTPKPKAKTK